MSSASSPKVSIDPRLLENSKNIIRALVPGIEEARLNQMAQAVTAQAQTISSSCANYKELQEKSKSLQGLYAKMVSAEEYAEFQSTLCEIDRERQNIGKYFSPGQPLTPEIEEKLNKSCASAIKRSQEMMAKTCAECQKPNQLLSKKGEEPKYLLQRCSRCQSKIYCSPACQAKHWPNHKIECLNHPK